MLHRAALRIKNATHSTRPSSICPNFLAGPLSPLQLIILEEKGRKISKGTRLMKRNKKKSMTRVKEGKHDQKLLNKGTATN